MKRSVFYPPRGSGKLLVYCQDGHCSKICNKITRLVKSCCLGTICVRSLSTIQDLVVVAEACECCYICGWTNQSNIGIGGFVRYFDDLSTFVKSLHV